MPSTDNEMEFFQNQDPTKPDQPIPITKNASAVGGESV